MNDVLHRLPMSVSTRRVACLAVAVAGLAAPLAGCGGSDDSPTDTSSSVPMVSEPAETTTPTTAAATPTSAATPTDSSAPDESATSYTIAAGDSLSAIATKAGVTVDALVEANGWTDGTDHLILPGDVISLPSGSSSAPTTAAGG